MASKGEKKISAILTSARVPFVQEYIAGAKGFAQKNLRYDFYLVREGQKCLIEFQGEEHYRFIPFFHASRADFQKRQIYDEKKISYALAHNFKMYCIPYWDIDSISTINDIFNPNYLARTKNHNYIAFEKYQKTLTSS